MKYLTTKVPLYLYELPSGPLITLESGSKLNLMSIKKSYHAYYELHSYSLNVEIDNKKYVVNCARYKDAKGSKSIRVNSSTSFNTNKKALTWDRVFEEEFEINTEI